MRLIPLTSGARSRHKSSVRIRPRFLPQGQGLESRDLMTASPLNVIPDPQGLSPARLTPASDGVYFTAYYDANKNPVSTPRLWYANGLTSGTRLVLGLSNVVGAIQEMAAAGNSLYVMVSDSANQVTRLYVCEKGVAHPVAPDSHGNAWYGQHLEALKSINGDVYFASWFVTYLGDYYWSLEKAEGTEAPKTLYSGREGYAADDLTGVGSKIYFSGSVGSDGRELWVYDPSLPEDRWVHEVKDINTEHGRGSDPSELTAVGNLVYFSASTLATGRELWVSDGTAVGTHVIDVNPGSADSKPQNLVNLNGALFFTATQGTQLSLFEVRSPGGTPQKVTNVSAFGAKAVAGSYFYAGLNKGSGMQLYMLADSGAMAPIADPLQIHSHGPAQNLTSFNGTLYFSATTSTGRVAIWKVISNNRVLPVARCFWTVNQMMDVGGTLYVAGSGTGAQGQNLGNELWKVDDNVPHPDALSDTATVAYEGTVRIPVLKNDIASNPLTIVAISSPLHGKAYAVDGTTITYVAPSAFTGTVTFNYTVSDGQSKDSTTVTVTVKPPTADQYPRVGFMVTSSTVNENAGYADIVVGVSKPFVYTVTVDFKITPGSAQPGIHYKVPAAKSLIFAPGVTRQTIRIPLINDKLPGPSRSAVITLSNPRSAKIGPKYFHTFTIFDSGTR